jgi:hypothetical protein
MEDVIDEAFSIHEMKITQFSSENLKGRDYLGDLHVDDRIILKWILRK